jgi:hypothetical protein
MYHERAITASATGPPLALPLRSSRLFVGAANCAGSACVSTPDGLASVAGCRRLADAEAYAASCARLRGPAARGRASLFEGALEIGGSLAELCHQFAQPRASSGSFWGPKTTRTITNTTIMWGCSTCFRATHSGPVGIIENAVPQCQTTLWCLLRRTKLALCYTENAKD